MSSKSLTVRDMVAPILGGTAAGSPRTGLVLFLSVAFENFSYRCSSFLSPCSSPSFSSFFLRNLPSPFLSIPHPSSHRRTTFLSPSLPDRALPVHIVFEVAGLLSILCPCQSHRPPAQHLLIHLLCRSFQAQPRTLLAPWIPLLSFAAAPRPLPNHHIGTQKEATLSSSFLFSLFSSTILPILPFRPSTPLPPPTPVVRQLRHYHFPCLPLLLRRQSTLAWHDNF